MAEKTKRVFKQFNWRFLLVRIIVNALALFFTALVVPSIYFVNRSLGNWLLMAVTLGVLNALLKPILQYLTLRFIFATFGLIVILVNALLLWLLALLFPTRFAVDSILWALVGGLVLGLVGSFLESLLGLTMPVVPDEPPELRQHLEEQARKAGWLAAGSGAPVTEGASLVPNTVAGQPIPAVAGDDVGEPPPAAPPPPEGAAFPTLEPEPPVGEPTPATGQEARP